MTNRESTAGTLITVGLAIAFAMGAVLTAAGCGDVSALTVDGGESDAGAAGTVGTAGAAGTGSSSVGAAGAAGTGASSGSAGGAAGAPWGPSAAPACKGELVNLYDCGRRIDGQPGGWQCARGCASPAGADIASGGACVWNRVTYCVPPTDGGDPCAACAP